MYNHQVLIHPVRFPDSTTRHVILSPCIRSNKLQSIKGQRPAKAKEPEYRPQSRWENQSGGYHHTWRLPGYVLCLSLLSALFCDVSRTKNEFVFFVFSLLHIVSSSTSVGLPSYLHTIPCHIHICSQRFALVIFSSGFVFLRVICLSVLPSSFVFG